MCYVDCNSQVNSSPVWLLVNHTHKKTINFRESKSETPGTPQHDRDAGFSVHHRNNLFPLKTCMVGFPEARGGQAHRKR